MNRYKLYVLVVLVLVLASVVAGAAPMPPVKPIRATATEEWARPMKATKEVPATAFVKPTRWLPLPTRTQGPYPAYP